MVAQGETRASTPVYGIAKFVEEAHGDYRLAAEPTDHTVGAFGPTADVQFPVRGKKVCATPALLPLGVASSGEVSVAYAGDAGTSWIATPNSPWISCTPAAGAISGKGSSVKAVITIDAAKTSPGLHRGAVTFRTDTGFLKTVFITATILPENPWSVECEAEALEQSGFSVEKSTSAGGGAYLVATNGTPYGSAAVKFDVDVPAEGDYQIWGRTLSEGSETPSHDSLLISLDGAEPRRWDFSWRSPAFWTWQAAGVWDGKDLALVRLAKGRHTIKILSREPGARLDSVYVGNHAVLDRTPVPDQDIVTSSELKTKGRDV